VFPDINNPVRAASSLGLGPTERTTGVFDGALWRASGDCVPLSASGGGFEGLFAGGVDEETTADKSQAA
jgi:hypothetical protein